MSKLTLEEKMEYFVNKILIPAGVVGLVLCCILVGLSTCAGLPLSGAVIVVGLATMIVGLTISVISVSVIINQIVVQINSGGSKQ